jgi:hypothetical protein
MKEHPILFFGEMVNAILDGRKTQTRRVIKPQPILMDSGTWYPSEIPGDKRNHTGKHYANENHMRKGMPIDFSPYGQPGDQLWVREAWKMSSFMEGEPVEFQYKSDGAMAEENEHSDCFQYENWYENICVKSTDQLIKMGWINKDEDGIFHWERGESPLPWRPSIHMPRWASRITLEIVNIRVERVNWINDIDGYAEGMIGGDCVTLFKELWDKLNAKRGYGWDVNPWVWVIEFWRIIP